MKDGGIFRGGVGGDVIESYFPAITRGLEGHLISGLSLSLSLSVVRLSLSLLRLSLFPFLAATVSTTIRSRLPVLLLLLIYLNTRILCLPVGFLRSKRGGEGRRGDLACTRAKVER